MLLSLPLSLAWRLWLNWVFVSPCSLQLALDTGGVPIAYVAKLCMARAQSINPYNLLLPFSNSSFTLRKLSTLFLALAITFALLVSQFLSPILLSDFGQGNQYWQQPLTLSYAISYFRGHPLKGPNYLFAEPSYPPR